MYTFLLVTFALGFAACQNGSQRSGAGVQEDLHSLESELAAARATYSPEALAYLESALDTIEAYHAIGPEHDWEELRLVALERTEGAQEPAETYDAIRFALEDLGDRHGSFRAPADTRHVDPAGPTVTGRQAEASSSVLRGVSVVAAIVGEKIGYVVVPPFISVEQGEVNRFATDLQSRIREIDESLPCGWVVDLRNNGGGNMWPMLAGIGPVLGEGYLGAGVFPDGRKVHWFYEDGKAILDTMILAEVTEAPYALHSPGSPVAVLINSRTGSSGEAVAIAFRGRPETRSFGVATGGAVSSPLFFHLPDGAWLGFSGSYFADRSGVVYRGPIEPDAQVAGDFPPKLDDEVVRTAIAWLNTKQSCRRWQKASS